MASQQINSSLCSNELATWWEHYDLMIESIKDPDALAEAACAVGLVSADMKDMIVGFSDAQAKTRPLLQMIEGKVKNHSIHFHQYVAMLMNLPGLNQLASRLQASYAGRLLGTPVVNDQEAGDHKEDDESNGSAVERGDNDSEAESSSSEMHRDDEQEQGSHSGGVHDINLYQVDNTVLGLEDEQAVREELITLAAKFDDIGITLGLPSGDLEATRRECVGDTKRGLGQVIRTWLKQSYNVARFGLPSWRSLVDAVDSPAGGSNHALAKRIASKYRVKKRNHDGADDPCTKISRIDDKRLDPVLSDGDLGKIADSMSEWKGSIAEQLELTTADIEAIQVEEPRKLKLQTRAALRTWRQRLGSKATYNNLIKVFEQASYNDLALFVRNLITNAPTNADNLSGNISHTPLPPAQLLSRPPQVTATSTVELQIEDQQVKKRNHNGADEPRTKVPRINVTDAPLMRFRPKLADFYSKKPEVPESAWPPIKKTHYVNLALIKPQVMKFGDDYARQTVRGSIDDIFKDKEEISYEDAFNKHDDRSRIVIILEGRPGCGKTTLMHKLSQDWEKGEVLSSYLLFLVHLRRFNNRSDVQLSNVLQAATLNFTKDDIEEMCKLIEINSGKGVVFALDGLDEYSPKSDNFIYNLIDGKQLTNAIVIVASRPAATQPFRRCASRHVEVLGFLEPQIREYINNFFSRCPDKAQGLLDYLKLHLNIMHMCYLPLHVAMVTHLYEIKGDNLPQTETEIYRHFTLSTLIRSFCKRCPDSRPNLPFSLCDFDQLSPEDQAVFNIVLQFAFTSTVESQQVFSLEDLRKYIPGKSPSCGDDESTLGLIVVDRYFVKYGLDEIYSFIHLTLQEYLSSVYISRQSDEEQKRIISSHGFNRRLAEVWKFYCGSRKCSRENFELLLSKTKTTIKKYQMQSMLLHLHCCHESQQEWTCTQVVNAYDSCIKLSKQSLTPSDMTALGYVMSYSETPLKKLVVSSCYVGPEGLTALAMELKEKLPELEVLSFKGTKIKSEMVDSFTNLLKLFEDSSAQELNLSSCVSKSTLSGITGKIPPLPSVKTLDISCNQLGNSSTTAKAFLDKFLNLQTFKVHLYKDCKWYISMKKSDQLNVKTIVPVRYDKERELDLATCTKLDLVGVKITDKEAEVIGERLKECSNLSKLDLSINNIGTAGAVAIAEGCKSCPNLQSINLSSNNIGTAGAEAIAEGCKSYRNLQFIDLGWNDIGAAGAEAIAEGCKSCPNLQSIGLNGNGIGDAGVQAITEGCKSCLELSEISLRSNSITDASVPHLIKLMETARKLKALYLYDNKFTEAGKSQLRQAAEKKNNDPTNYARLSLGV